MAKTSPAPAAERITFKLSTPIIIDGAEIQIFQYRRPKGRDMRRFMNGGDKPGDKLVRLWADLCELPEKVFDELDGEDWTRLAGEFGGFLGIAQETSTS
jgi:hypothetical protein